MVVTLLLLHTAATLAMVGVVWFVQVVHYPLFSRVGRSEFRRYEFDHQRLTTKIVVPLMMIELASGVYLALNLDQGVIRTMFWCSLVLLVGIWLMTYLRQVPQHAALILRYDPMLLNSLVRGNWARTIAWTLRGVILLMILGQVIYLPLMDAGTRITLRPM